MRAQVNRATSETMRLQATQEALVPLKNEPDLEFVWVGDDAIDPLQQAQTLNILVSAGIKTREEARAELGLGGEEKAGAPAGLGKFNPNHDERGRFATEDNAPGSVGKSTRKPQPKGVQVASNDAVASDLDARGTTQVGQIMEPQAPESPPPTEAPEPARPAETTTSGTVATAVAPDGKLPGVGDKLGDPRTMPASDDPDSTAQDFVRKAYNGQIPISLDPLAGGGFVAKMPDGAVIIFRAAGQASWRTPGSTASVDINDARLNQLNAGEFLKLKFPKK